jgi:thioredoxin 1
MRLAPEREVASRKENAMTVQNSNSAIVRVGADNFDSVVLKSPLPVLIDVSATWCAPCKVARPVVAGLARTHHGRLQVVEIDGDESPELVERLGVRGYPTFLGVFGGEVVERRVGFGGRRVLDELAGALVERSATAEPA